MADRGAADSAGAPGRVAVVIPCYRVRAKVLEVISGIGHEVDRIYCVDDACPERSGDHVEASCRDPRVVVLRHPENRGVGAAMVTGYRQALTDGIELIVKMDGDGQMDPALLPALLMPLRSGQADYVKGNRFYAPESLEGMPRARLLGDAVLSFLTKLSTGYWTVFDPTNGYTAIHRNVLAQLALSKIAPRYFFESDMLFRLNTIRAVVADVPMRAHYHGEPSSLRIGRIVLPFLGGHLRNFGKRIVYNYFLRDFHLASVELVLGVVSLAFGLIFGGLTWIGNARQGVETPAGTVMLAGLPIIVGIQMLLAFLNYDIQSVPRRPIQGDLGPFL